MDKVYVYSCPSCGAKVDYNKNEKVWECSHCGNKYNSLFKKENKELPSIVEHKKKYYKYHCNDCNTTFLLLNKEANNCVKCKSDNILFESELEATNIIRDNSGSVLIYDKYLREISHYAPDIRETFKTNDFSLEYFDINIFNGYVRLEYNELIEEFIMFNLLVPNIEFDDYRFMLDIANEGISYSKEIEENEEKFDKYDFPNVKINSNKINGNNKVIKENKIALACKQAFMNKYSIKDENGIKMSYEFNNIEDYYLPVYYKEVKENDITYREYEIANSAFRRDGKGHIIELPKDVIEKNIGANITKIIMYIIFAILSAIIPVLFIIGIIKTNNVYYLIFFVISFFLFGFASVTIRENEALKERKIISEEEYLNRITNCKYIRNINKSNKGKKK